MIPFLFAALATLELPAIFSDHMVLQRDQAIPVWGIAVPGEVVTVRLEGSPARQDRADIHGHWRVDLPAEPASTNPRVLRIEGRSVQTFEDVLVGEVWICSGQSNMEWSILQSKDAQLEIEASEDPWLRHIKVNRATATEGQFTFEGAWELSSPKVAGNWTAVGTHFGRKLRSELGVPVGLINTTWGGTRIEPWCDPSALAQKPAFEELVESRRADPQAPGALFDAMVHPLIPYGMRGAVWYQGESNAGEPERYRELLPLMIRSWRDAWGQGDFPFGVVQLAPFKSNGRWAELREAQDLGAQAAGNAGLVVLLDVGNPTDMHPADKQTVGRRLGRWALAQTYGRNILPSGPKVRSVTFSESSCVLELDYAVGLSTSDDAAPGAFEVSTDKRSWQTAEATIAGNQITISGDGIRAVRYAWSDVPADANVVNADGLPMAPFRWTKFEW
ncbi:MAG: sialate O-acetylesterase [Planctomycetota bacterium]|nr:sialate O-acetylesterase [Planctomycetota bacterium]